MVSSQFKSAGINADGFYAPDVLDANYHFSPGLFDVPACVVTDIKTEKILASSAPFFKQNSQEESSWVLSGAKVVITRFWSSSTAYFSLVCDLMDPEQLTPAIPQDLRVEKEICIYMGYLDHPRAVTFQDLATSSVKNSFPRLYRVYVGVIEVIATTMTGTGGCTVSFQCRDRMKWLMDSHTTFNPTAEGILIEKNVPKGPKRSDLILAVARRGIGVIDPSEEIQTTVNSDANTATNSTTSGNTALTNAATTVGTTVVDALPLDSSSKLNSRQTALIVAAGRIGMPPEWLASIISKESSFIHTKCNTIDYCGLIQFSPENRAFFNVDLNDSWENQIKGPVVEYFKNAGFRPGMTLTQAYATVLTGNPNGDPIEEDIYGTSVANAPIYPGDINYIEGWKFLGGKAGLQAAGLKPVADPFTRGNGGNSTNGPATGTPSASGTTSTTTQTIKPESCGCGKDIKRSEKYTYDADDTIAENKPVLDPNSWYVNDGPLQNTLKIEQSREPQDDPEFRIFTSRDSLNTAQKTEFLVSQQIPVEMIKYLAMQEVYPTEVFQHHIDGNFYYSPRMNDSSGLQNPKLFYRTYFCRVRPKMPKSFEDLPKENPQGEQTQTSGTSAPQATPDSNKPTASSVTQQIQTQTGSELPPPDSNTQTPASNTQTPASQPASESPAGATQPIVFSPEEEKVKEDRSKKYNDLASNSSSSLAAAVQLNNTNQMLLRFKEESTSVGLKTNILVRSSSSNVAGALGEYNLHLQTRPYVLKRPEGSDKKPPAFACKFAIYQDVTIKNTTEAAVVAMNLARILGKETRAATGVLIGDPTLCPGEVCQVIGSPFQYQNLTQGQFMSLMAADRAKYFSFENNSISSAIEYIKALQAAEKDETNSDVADLKVFDETSATIKTQSTSQENSASLICNDASRIYSANNSGANEGLQDLIGYNEEPRSMWRVEAIIHKFNMGGAGYTTEVAWTSPF